MPSKSISRSARRHNPLADDLAATGNLRVKSNKRKAKAEEDEDRYVDSRSSRKILKIGQELADEDEKENGVAAPNPAFAIDSRFGDESGSEHEIQDEEAWDDMENEVVEEEVDAKDLDLYNRFLPAQDELEILPTGKPNGQADEGTNLADLILEKIAVHEAATSRQPVAEAPDGTVELPAKVVEVYSKIGLLLSRYKSGQLPKPFKVIPTIPQWEELLEITRPESWTPNACYEATRIFVSHKPYIVQHFLQSVLLERVREDIHETKKLNVHLYKALKKALYKPAAFFKGFLFPLVSSGTCTLREAHIVSSVLVRVSIPVLHSAAALLRLTEIAAEQSSTSTESAGATNVFIRVLLEKKYALPYKVIDGLVFHFLRFRATPGDSTESNNLNTKDLKLPVIWHQCLLAFAQRYRNDVTEDQREALLDLLLVRWHKDIGPEVRRELLEGRGRGVPVEEPGGAGGDDTMVLDSN